jgi:uncharacterized protein YjcR
MENNYLGVGMRNRMYKRKRNRLREIEFGKIEEVKEVMKMQWKEIANLLGISPNQILMYRKSNGLPASRYYALRDSLLLAIEEEARERRERVMTLFDTNI